MPKFYPRLSKLISTDKLPAFLSGVSNIFDKLYFRNFQTVKSYDGVTVSYVIEVISYKELKIDIAGSGFSLLLNPDFSGTTVFPLSLSTRWGIRKYIKNFNVSFGDTAQEFFNTLFEVVSMEDRELIMVASIIFIDDTEDPLTAFLDDFNTAYEPEFPYELTNSDDFEGSVEEIIEAFNEEEKSVRLFIFNQYISDTDPSVTLDNVRKLFSFKIGGDPIQQLKDLIIPYASARV